MFKTLGEAWAYCEKFGLKHVRSDIAFEVAEALHRAYEAGQAAQPAGEAVDGEYCLYCKKVHDIRWACPEWIEAMKREESARR